MKVPALIAVLGLCVLFPVIADGAGGAFWGSQQIHYPWASYEDSIFSSTADRLDYVGGMGFGIDHDGTVSGGFGVGFSEQKDGEKGVSGGFGGLITGHRIFKRPLNLIGLLFVGVGGVSDEGSADPKLQDGVFSIMGEGTLEASLPLSFFHPTVYAGYQVIASVGSGGIGETYLSYSPTIGFRMLFGDL